MNTRETTPMAPTKRQASVRFGSSSIKRKQPKQCNWPGATPLVVFSNQNKTKRLRPPLGQRIYLPTPISFRHPIARSPLASGDERIRPASKGAARTVESIIRRGLGSFCLGNRAPLNCAARRYWQWAVDAHGRQGYAICSPGGYFFRRVDCNFMPPSAYAAPSR